MGTRRRSVLRALGGILAGSVAGCLSSSPREGATGTQTPNRSGSGTTTRTTDASASATSGTAEPTASPSPVFEYAAVDDLPAECPSDGIDQFPGITPRPVPERPERPNGQDDRAFGAFVREYERYYLKYRALFELGGQTPDGRPDVSAHYFPDVSMVNPELDRLDSGGDADDPVVVRLAYRRVVEGEVLGGVTVTYYLTDDRIVRAETAGRVYPGPNPTTDGRRQQCPGGRSVTGPGR